MTAKHSVDTYSDILIALGGNLPSTVGSPVQTLQNAISALVEAGVTLRGVSRFYTTPCFPAGAGPDYVNAVISGRYGGTPGQLLAVLHEIEANFLRTREQRWGMRTLDLDLLDFAGVVLPDEAGFVTWRHLTLEEQMQSTPSELILPHPRIQDRAFVLVPACDVAREWNHPVLGQTVQEMLNALPVSEREGVTAL